MSSVEPVAGDHRGGRSSVGYRAGVGHHAYGSTFANEHALNRAYHGRYGGSGGYGGGDYWGGYYGGGGVYYGDADYGYGYGGYGDDYAGGVPAAYSALTYPSSYQRIYQVAAVLSAGRAHELSASDDLSGQPAHHLSPGPNNAPTCLRRDRETGH